MNTGLVYKAESEHEMAKNNHTATVCNSVYISLQLNLTSVFYKTYHSTICPVTSTIVIPVQSITSTGKQYAHNEGAPPTDR